MGKRHKFYLIALAVLPLVTAEPYVAPTEPPAAPADTPAPTAGPAVKRLKKVSNVKLSGIPPIRSRSRGKG